MTDQLAIEWWPIEKLIPYARNPRKNDHAVDDVAASIKEFGWTQSIVVDAEGVVVAGHTRLKAAIKLGLTEVPVYSAKKWTDAQAKAYRIADNKVAEKATWDQELLGLEVSDLLGAGAVDLAIGFTNVEIDSLIAGTKGGKTDPDETPPAPDEPVSKPGDIWVMGEHRLICGDSTDAETVAALLQGRRPHLMVTDPPYGVEYDADWRNHTGDDTRTGRATGKVLNDDKADWREAWELFPGEVAYVWHADRHTAKVADSLAACSFEVRSQLIWSKSQLVISRGHYHSQHEPCWYAVRKGGKGHWCGDRKQTTVWDIAKPKKSESGHSTQKPVECMARPIRNNSAVGDLVYEPFSGSGTTIIAAQQERRVCYAVELNPTYVDVAVKRWEAFTGEKAVLERTETEGD